MSVRILKTAIGAAALSLTLTPAWAQQGGHQMAGTQGSAGSAATCAQNSEGVTRAIDVVNGRIEDARQTNDAAKLRASIADLQVVFAQMKAQLADCVALGGAAGGVDMPGMDHSKAPMAPAPPVMQPGSAASAERAPAAAPMAGMDHSKMPMAAAPAKAAGAGAAAKAAKPAVKPAAPMAGMDHSKMAGEKAAPAAAVVFTVRTDPAPPRSGKNDFEVTLKDAEGKPIMDAAVSLAFSMAAMPSMKSDAAQLAPAGNGVYKGSATIGMSGDWDVTITASRKGQTLAVKKVKLTAK